MVDELLLASLDRDGFAVVPNAIDEEVVADLNRWSHDLVAEDLEWRLGEVQRRRDRGEQDARAFPRGEEGRFFLLRHDERRDVLVAAGASGVRRERG